MTFINPYFLFGLAAVLIPIFLHLFNLHKVRKMEFSTLMFLKEIQKAKLRRIKIKQLLLLILRILIIVFLVFAFSSPVYKGYLPENNKDIRKCGIIVFDNSFSMSAKDDKGSYIEQAKKSLENILNLYTPNDKLILITSSHINHFKDGEYRDAQSMLDSVKNIEFTCVPFYLSNILNAVKEETSKENFPLYEVFILSDFQKNNLITENSDKKLFSGTDKNIHFFNIDIGKRVPNNISIEKTEIKSKILETNKEIKISVILTNHNNFNAINKQVNLIVNGKKAAETVVDLVSHERKEVVFTFKPDRAGSSSVYAELLQNDFFEDEISQDNKFYFTYFIPEKINVGLISDNDIGTKYIKLAIESAEKLNNAAPQKFYNVSSYSFISDNIKNSDMIIISGKNNFSEDESVKLKEYVNSGGGVLIFPSNNINLEGYNSLFSRFNAFRIEGLTKVNSDTISQRKFGKIDFEHPIFYGTFKNEELSITSDKFFVEAPKLNFIYNINQSANSQTLMTLNSKKFLAESKSDDGKVILCAVSAEDDMSDFPSKSLFPLIINKSIFYLGNGIYKNENNIVGNNNVVTAGKNKIFSIPYNPVYKEPGIYSVKDSANNNYYFALNRDTLESDLRKSVINDVNEFYKLYDIKNAEYIDEQTDANNVITKSREGTELWKLFVILALIFIVLEMIYSKKLEKI